MSGCTQRWQEDNPLANVPRLANENVHVWSCSLDDPPISLARLKGVLSPAERDHAERHVFLRDRTRSVASRGLLRWLLGAYLNVEPGKVRLGIGPHGKPELAGQHDWSGLSFNVAHSDEVVVYALTHCRELGVDIERLRPMPDAADVAIRFFAQSEIEALLALPPDRRDKGFFVCWTRKEAYVKACGVGLAAALDEFEVRLDHAEGSDRLRIPANPDQAARWMLYDLRPLPGFLGAVAVTGQNLQFCCFRWTQ